MTVRRGLRSKALARWRRSECSLAALMALGLQPLAWPQHALAQPAGSTLAPGTLPVLRAVVGGQAILRAPEPAGAGQRLQIDQLTPRAIIDWRSFNIGSASEVRFNQPDATASALNRIYSADPSIIQGKLTANGQVLLINQNGILFDRGSQVNVGALVASTLNLSNDTYTKGLSSGGNNKAAFEGGYGVAGTDSGDTDLSRTSRGAIVIGGHGPGTAAGPVINAAAAGSILMFAPLVDNRAGVIQAPDGQVILAAGSKVYLTDANPELVALRGMVVEVKADAGPVDLTSLVRNLGTVSADRGNVTLAGLAINQQGRVSASTAVLYNGSVWLKAGTVRDGSTPGSLVSDKGGTVTVGPAGVVSAPLDLLDKTTMTDAQSYASVNPIDDRRGSIRIDAAHIEHLGRIEAPGGRVRLTATDSSDPASARIWLGSGSTISAAGSWTEVGHDKNLLTFRVTSNELKDSPLLRDSFVKGSTVTVDLRKGSPLLDLSGYVDGVQRSVSEKAAVGGEVALVSTGSLIQRPDATVDVSGGGYAYGAGAATTSRLLGEDGRVYDIGNAPNDRRYVALLDSFTKSYSRWGQTEVWKDLNRVDPVREAGYVEGKSGGSLLLQAPAGMLLDGQLLGGATSGPRQLAAAPAGGTLQIGTDITRRETTVPVGDVRFVKDRIDHLPKGFTSTAPLSPGQADTLNLAGSVLYPAAAAGPEGGLAPQRFASIEINSRGVIEVPPNVSLDVGAGSALVLRGQQVELAGRIDAPAGEVQVLARKLVSAERSARSEQITLHPGAEVSAAGLWSNSAGRDGEPIGPTMATAVGGRSTLAGGSVTLNGARLDLAPGAVIDVSGGGSVARNNRIAAGAAGRMVLQADSAIDAVEPSVLQADLKGFSLGAGGSLTLRLPDMQVGRRNPTLGDVVIDESLFGQGGFERFDLSGALGLRVAFGTHIEPLPLTWQVDGLDAAQLPSGGRLSSIAVPVLLAPELRRAGSVALRSRGSSTSEVTVEQGSSIKVGVGGSITLEGNRKVDLNATLQAPGGTVALTVNGAPNTEGAELRLGPWARVSADGQFVARANDAGARQGSVSAGGTVTLDATRARVVMDSSAIVSVNGATQVLDLGDPGAVRPYKATAVSSEAGVVVVRAQDGARLAGTFSGRSPDGVTAGGSFALELVNRDDDALPENTSRSRRIVLTQNRLSADTDPKTGDAHLAVNALSAGGFDKLRLQAENTIELREARDVAFARGVRLDTAEIRLADSDVSVEGASVVLANSFGRRGTGGGSAVDNSAASSRVATAPGQSTLEVRARTLDVYGDVTINGARQTRLLADGDIRLSGRAVGSRTSAEGATLQGSLTSAGDLDLVASQVYPTTRSSFNVAVEERSANGLIALTKDGAIRVAANGREAGAALSAGGKLVLNADQIEQSGMLRAPLGEIALNGTTSVVLGSGSTTSVSAAGATLPFGTTDAGVSWLYSATNAVVNVNDLQSPPAKRIVLNGAAIQQRSGATVDISGGGELLATEFVPGSGGSKDILLQDNTYAIIPKAKLTAMPVDPHIAAEKDLGLGLLTQRVDRATYDSIHIGPGAAVPEGDYVLLPGRYALLPDAYLVQLQTGAAFNQMQAGQTVKLANGQTVVAGYRVVAGTGQRESRAVGVVVRAGSDAKRESDYNLTGSDFFARLADGERRDPPALPRDAGSLALTASRTLALDGRISTTAVDGARRAEVDISGSRIAIVDRAGQVGIDPTALQLEAGSLSRIQGSVLIGGQRSNAEGAVRVTTLANEVRIANTSAQPLALPEVMITALDRIDVQAGAVVSSEGTRQDTPTRAIKADAGGALVRIASSGVSTVDRGTAPDTSRGVIDVAAGATLTASGSLTLDATRDTRSQGRLQALPGATVALAAGRISLGDVAGSVEGLSLDNMRLAEFGSLDALSLKSYGGIDIAAAAQVGSSTLKQLTLDSASLRAIPGPDGRPQAASRIAAATVVLTNSATSSVPAGTGSADLVVTGDRIISGTGDKAISGFRSVQLNAAGDVLIEGEGSLRVGGDLAVQSQRVVGTSGANQTWRAVQDTDPSALVHHPVRLTALPLAAGVAPPDALGARLAVQGSSIDSEARVLMNAGSVSLSALGAGDGDGVRLRSGSVVDVRGGQRSFNGTVATADAGRIDLQAERGHARLDNGASLLLDGATAGGHAGRLSIRANSLQLEGTVTASASAGADAGRFSLDTTLPINLPALNATLDRGGFFESRELRQREGDIGLDVGQVMKARQIALTADAGAIAIGGTLDASSAHGAGRIQLAARTALTLGEAAVLDASARSTDAASVTRGGQVTLDAREGTLAMASGARIDVRAGETGTAGRVRFTAARSEDNTGVAVDLRGTVLSLRHAGDVPADVLVEGRRVVEAGDASQAPLYAADHKAFIEGTSRDAILGALRGDDGRPMAAARLGGALEVRSVEGFRMGSNWDLASADWLSGAGTLTIRTAGTLTIDAALGLPNDLLVDRRTWNLRLAGGADLSSADAMASLPAMKLATGLGDVLLEGDEARVRSGTGSIEIAAGRDFRILSEPAVVTTSGLPSAPNPASTASVPNPAAGIDSPWVRDGGDIRISAGRDATGLSNQWIGDWLRRPRGTAAEAARSGWWAYRPNFRQGLASFGGGDLQIDAGRDVDHLSAMSVTSGRVTGQGEARQLDVQGGGDLRVSAARDLLGGDYLVARGAGRIDAGGEVGKGDPTQLYLMGQSSDAATARASMSIQAGGSASLQSVDNPTALGLTVSRAISATGTVQNFAVRGTSVSYFNTYAPDARVDVRALSGEVAVGTTLRDRPALSGTANDQNVIATSAAAGSFYPGQLNAVAFAGSIRQNKGEGGGEPPALTLSPSSAGGLTLLARQDLLNVNLIASDKLPSTVAAWDRVQVGELLAGTGSALLNQSLSDPRLVSRSGVGAPTPAFDVQALLGDVRDSSFTLAARAQVRAGRDITGGSLLLQNLAEADLSRVQADLGDIRPGGGGISISGPGRLLIQAGRSAHLQAPTLADGNARNPSLATGGSARLTVVAGVSGELDLSKLDAAYLELIEAGRVQDKARASAAMAAFFKGAKLQPGDIDSFLSSIQTSSGSDVDLLAPRGDITVGLTSPGAQTVGAVTNAGGAIRSFLEGNFNINQGKVVTAQSGDILIYTSEGNIDAGRGARTSVTTPAPRRVPIVDGQGNVSGYRFVLASGVAGSGIQTVTSDPDGPGPLQAPKAGSVYLFAPAGFVDAGEAGIVSGSDIVIAAQVVLNASNISAVGSSKGVPVETPGTLASSLAAGGTTSSGGNKAAEDAAAAATAAAKAATAAENLPKPTILTVEVLGFGEKNCKEGQKDCFAK